MVGFFAGSLNPRSGRTNFLGDRRDACKIVNGVCVWGGGRGVRGGVTFDFPEKGTATKGPCFENYERKGEIC